LQAGGRRFESDHLHHDPGFTDRGGEVVGEVVRVYRGEAKVIGTDGFAPEESQDGTAMPLASPMEMPVPGSSPRTGLCQGESDSGASLGVPARMSDRMCCP
jgi:hypothetical protein